MTAPVLANFATAVTFAENTVNATPQLLDTAVSFSDAEGDFSGGFLTLSGLLPEDRASLRHEGTGTGQIGLSGADVSYGGTVIGTLNGGSGSTLTITFNANATSAAIEALIQNLTYANVSDTPVAARTLILNVIDASGQDIVPTTFAPLTGVANPFDGFDVGLTSAPSFADLDGDGDMDLIVGEYFGTLQVWTNSARNFIAQTGPNNPFNGIDVGYLSTPSFVDLDGDEDMDLVSGAYDGTLSVWTNAAGVFTAQTGAANPFDGIDVGFRSNPTFVDLDGDGDLDLVVGENGGALVTYENTTPLGATIVVTVTSENDAPTLTGFAPSITFDENTVNATPQLIDPSVVFADGEGNFNGGSLTLSGMMDADVVGIRDTGVGPGQFHVVGGEVSYGGVVIGQTSIDLGGAFTVTFNAFATSAIVEALIQNLTYFNASDTPVATRTLTLQITDAAGESLTPNLFSTLTGAANPFNGLSAGTYSAPSVVDLDGDGDLDLVSGEAGVR